MHEPWSPYSQTDVDHDAPVAGAPRWSGLRRLFNAADPLSPTDEPAPTGQARIALAGAPGAGRRELLLALWGLAPEQLPPGSDFGTFLLVDLPEGGGVGAAPPDPAVQDAVAPPYAAPRHAEAHGWPGSPEDTLAQLAGADLVLFVIDARRGLDAAGFLGFSRVRALGCPLLVVLTDAEALPDGGRQRGRELARRLARPVLAVSPARGLGLEALLRRMLASSPAVAIPLGRESLPARPLVVRQLARRAALRSFVVGLEPVPLLDLPLQVAGHRRLLSSLAAVYGETGAEDLRSWTAAAAGGLALRMGAAQLAKLVPVAGWLASGLIGAAGSLALARLADQRHRGGLRLRRPSRPGALSRWSRRGRTEAGASPTQGLGAEATQGRDVLMAEGGWRRRGAGDGAGREAA